MHEVVFDHWDDDSPVPPEADRITQLMRERGEDYWNNPAGPGFASLYFYAEGKEGLCTSTLVFTKSDAHGFHFLFDYPVCIVNSPYYRENESYYSCSDSDLKEWVAVRDSHEGRRPIFTGLFVPIDAAVEVVREFIRSGKRSDCVRWVTCEFSREAELRHGLA